MANKGGEMARLGVRFGEGRFPNAGKRRAESMPRAVCGHGRSCAYCGTMLATAHVLTPRTAPTQSQRVLTLDACVKTEWFATRQALRHPVCNMVSYRPESRDQRRRRGVLRLESPALATSFLALGYQ